MPHTKAQGELVSNAILHGCLQPDQVSSTYSDALNRLTDLLHYLNSSGDKSQGATPR